MSDISNLTSTRPPQDLFLRSHDWQSTAKATDLTATAGLVPAERWLLAMLSHCLHTIIKGKTQKQRIQEGDSHYFSEISSTIFFVY